MATYYVAPDGSSSNDGSLASPWSLLYALTGAGGTLAGDDTVYLRGGTYTGHFLTNVAGTSGHPITFRNYPDERPIIDGNASTVTTSTLPSIGATEVTTTVDVTDPDRVLVGITTVIDGGTTDFETVDTLSKSGNTITIHRYGPAPAHGTGVAIWTYLVANLTIAVGSDYLTFRGIEVTDTATDDRTKQADGQPMIGADDQTVYLAIRRRGGIDVKGDGVTIIDCVIHDCFQGITAFAGAADFESSGNVIYNNGMLADDRGHGHGIYTQNQTPSTKLFYGTISGNNFGYAWQQYGSGSSFLDNFTWTYDVAFCKPATPTITPGVNLGCLWGGDAAMNDIIIEDGSFYRAGFAIGYGSADNDGLTIRRNVVRDAMTFLLSKNVLVRDNLVVPRPADLAYCLSLYFNESSKTIPDDYTFIGNTYYGAVTNNDLGAGTFAFIGSDAAHPGGYTWWNTASTGHGYLVGEPDSWQDDYGYDTGSPASVFHEYGDPITGTTIKQFVDPYDATRHTVTIFNWDFADTVEVDVSGWGWSAGQGYRWRNPADYYDDTGTGTYNGGGTITLPMTGHSVAVPHGYTQALGDDTFPEFGCFVITEETIPVEPTFPDASFTTPIFWLELTTKDAALHPFAEVDLTDPLSYYGGYKRPLVESWAPIVRGLSDATGQVEHVSYGTTLIDIDRSFRSILTDFSANRYLTNRPLIIRVIDDADRRLLNPARTVMSGYVSDYGPQPTYRFQLTGTDWLKRQFTRSVRGQTSWQPLILASDFPDAPVEVLNQPAPVIYGHMGLIGADPVTGVTAIETAQPGSAPTSFAATTGSGGYGREGVTVYYQLSAMVSGEETPRAAHVFATPDATNPTVNLSWDAVGSASTIRIYRSQRSDFLQFECLEIDGAETTFADQWVGNDPRIGTQEAGENGSPWVLGLRMNVTYYVFARLPDGTYTQPAQAQVIFTPITGERLRHALVSWDDYPTATAYRIIRLRSYYSNWDPQYDRQWDQAVGGSPQTLADDFTDTTAVTFPDGASVALSVTGQVPAIHVGTEYLGSPTDWGGGIAGVPTRWHRLLLAAHACKTIGRIDYSTQLHGSDPPLPGQSPDVFHTVSAADFGVSWLAPGHAGWPFTDSYQTINGRRYTIIYTTLEPVPEKVFVDVDGIESIGDGTGPLITSIVLQAKHFALNYLARPKPTAGNWRTSSPMFEADTSLPMIDVASFAAVDVVTQSIVPALGDEPAGFSGAGILGVHGEVLGAEAALARFAVCGDFDLGWNRNGSLIASIEPLTVPTVTLAVNEYLNLVDQSFSITDDVGASFYNVLPYRHTQDYTQRVTGGWISSAAGDLELRASESVDHYDEEIGAPVLELSLLRNNSPRGAATITAVLERKIRRYSNPLRRVTFTIPLSGLSVDLGDVVTVTTAEGVSSEGWVDRAIRVTRHEVDPNTLRVTLEGYDLQQVLDVGGSP